MLKHKINFNSINWETPIKGVKSKTYNYGDKQIRLIEYSKDMPPHWCEKGHYGYIIEGELVIEFSNEKIIYKKGDGIFIPAGAEHKHKGKAITDTVKVIFVEDTI
ncbi:MAG TPA: cupin domain-containing protein [Ignavibacteria bacterium]|nr:cupin domain-containing protein [Ignavibacteria bacterium]